MLNVGLFLKTSRKLQLVQNSAAQLSARAGWRDHITPALWELHWLLISLCAQFKVLVKTF